MTTEPRTLSTRGLYVGFALVLVLMTAGAGFSLWSARRAAGRIDTLVAASLERERLIGLMRLDAALLTQAADAHINAATDEERSSAAHAMDIILEEIQETSTRFATDLPRGDAALWVRLSDVSSRLVKKVDVTIKASNRKEAERARAHLEEEVKPISFELDDTAGALARKNAEETRALLRELQEMRLRTSGLGSAAVGLAIVTSLIVAALVVRTLRRQQRVITTQMTQLDLRNRELDAFASRVAHDLVSPLSPLKGYLTLARRQVGDTEVKELLAQAESSTARMSELVEALLRFCRAGKSHDRGHGELDTAVTTILLEQSQAAQALGVQLERSVEPRVVAACPAQLLQSIAQNVLSNAVKYSAGRPGAQVQVAVRRDGASALLEVQDNGPGMTPEVQAQLFQPFFRAPEARHIPGTGLGLATTKRLVEAHGGSIAVESQSGAGTTVRVRLPLGDAPATADAAPPLSATPSAPPLERRAG